MTAKKKLVVYLFLAALFTGLTIAVFMLIINNPPDCPSNGTVQSLVDASTYYCTMKSAVLEKQIDLQIKYVNENGFKNISQISKLLEVSSYAQNHMGIIEVAYKSSEVGIVFELNGKNEEFPNITPQDWAKVTVKLDPKCNLRPAPNEHTAKYLETTCSTNSASVTNVPPFHKVAADTDFCEKKSQQSPISLGVMELQKYSNPKEIFDCISKKLKAKDKILILMTPVGNKTTFEGKDAVGSTIKEIDILDFYDDTLKSSVEKKSNFELEFYEKPMTLKNCPEIQNLLKLLKFEFSFYYFDSGFENKRCVLNSTTKFRHVTLETKFPEINEGLKSIPPKFFRNSFANETLLKATKELKKESNQSEVFFAFKNYRSYVDRAFIFEKLNDLNSKNLEITRLNFTDFKDGLLKVFELNLSTYIVWDFFQIFLRHRKDLLETIVSSTSTKDFGKILTNLDDHLNLTNSKFDFGAHFEGVFKQKKDHACEYKKKNITCWVLRN